VNDAAFFNVTALGSGLMSLMRESVVSIASGSDVTIDVVRNALAGDTTIATQGAVSLPMIQRYVDKLLAGDVAPAISKVGNAITDGHHRYIAGKILGRAPEIKPGVMTSAKEGRMRAISEVLIDPEDWGGH
jgi:hypothetical protein